MVKITACIYLLLLLLPACVVGQTTKGAANDTTIFSAGNLDQEPEFPGGRDGLIKYLLDSMQYPLIAKQGRVESVQFIKMIVEKSGQLSNIQISHPVSPYFDAEAIRLVESMPNWRPGIKHGKPVRVAVRVPIRFQVDAGMPDTSAAGAGDRTIHRVAEQMPEYPGGQKAMMKMFEDSIRYPEAAKAKAIKGTVYIKFVVKEDGSINMIELERGLDEYLDAEAFRLVRAMPRWTPGKQGDKPVKVEYRVSIRFKP